MSNISRLTCHKQQAKSLSHALTLVEVLIVVAILGILAALVVPSVQGYIQKSKEAAAKRNLQLLRSTIERYAIEHNGIPPGYLNDDLSRNPDPRLLHTQLVENEGLLSAIPINPFNGKKNPKMILDGSDFPNEPFSTNLYGWIYKPATKEIRLNWQGNDSEGKPYFEY